MKKQVRLLFSALGALVLCSIVVFAWQTVRDSGWSSLFLLPDQQGRVLFSRGKFEQAAEAFADPFWRGVSLYRAGRFKEAGSIFQGFDRPEAAYNHGNALCMLGKYAEAIPKYEQALAFRPDWEAAQVNLQIAVDSAKRLEKKGGTMSQGELEADEYSFTRKESSAAEAQEEVVEGGEALSDDAVRALWLRKVKTRPADFLQAKFAYQQSMQEQGEQ